MVNKIQLVDFKNYQQYTESTPTKSRLSDYRLSVTLLDSNDHTRTEYFQVDKPLHQLVPIHMDMQIWPVSYTHLTLPMTPYV